MPRYKIVIEYDGTRYSGWQKQPNLTTIQGQIESALTNLTNKKVEIMGSGRTDAGVHALGQVAHFDLEEEFEPFKIQMAVNFFLKMDDIAILDCQKVADNFHSRFLATKRIYQYKILNRRAQPAIDKNRLYHVPFQLDLNLIKEAAQYLIGKHDFSSFRDSECQANDAIRRIDYINIIEQENNIIIIEIAAKSFLHHMVRNIIGTLIHFSKKDIAPEKIKEILEIKDRTKSGPNAPSWGLYFTKVIYEHN
ncbi:tRNA pseudouridine(38-40) synthase TruA [Rickettsiales bacterium]|nr:tRNA pseudouridine(38-40) synthase TruA [Rickettsiales bacterium]MDB2550294.1 tRNA pseudouridine(38-40) synthase TruA [Rickettsiales bacterium]